MKQKPPLGIYVTNKADGKTSLCFYAGVQRRLLCEPFDSDSESALGKAIEYLASESNRLSRKIELRGDDNLAVTLACNAKGILA